MRLVPDRFILFVTSAAFSLAIACVPNVVVAACPTTMIDVLGAQESQKLRVSIEEAQSSPHAPIVPAPPRELANAGLNLLFFKKLGLLNPLREGEHKLRDEVMHTQVSAYFGDQRLTSPDVFTLPKDDRLLCQIAPGRVVFLSDGISGHFAMVDWIDYPGRIVTFVDPWAPVSFLLPGRNVVGVRGRAHSGKQGLQFLDISFKDFQIVATGIHEELAPLAYLTTLKKLYPELAESDDFLFWKYSSLLASLDDSAANDAWREMKQVSYPPDSKMHLLVEYAEDYEENVRSASSFSGPILNGRIANERADSETLGRRAEFLRRLGRYVSVLPWTSNWLLEKRIIDPELRLSALDEIIKANVSDVDFRIARGQALMDLDRLTEALTEFAKAEDLWYVDLKEILDPTMSPEQGMTFFLAKNYNSAVLTVLHWRFARIRLYQAIAELRSGKQVDPSLILSDLRHRYKLNTLDIDFFGEILVIYQLSHSSEAEVAEIEQVIPTVRNKADGVHVAEVLYTRFLTGQPVSAFPASVREKLRGTPLGGTLCIIANDPSVVGYPRSIPTKYRSNLTDLLRFCGT